MQRYCATCKVERRQESRSLHNHTYNMKHADAKNEVSRAYNKSEKGRAAQKLRDAVRKGEMVRQPCEVCNEPDAQGHHTDYSKPLEVRWLCPKHHKEEHLYEPWQNDMRRAGYNGGFELSELIEACGDKFACVEHAMEGHWIADAWNTDNKSTFSVEGHTPSEAVANLWISLNKK